MRCQSLIRECYFFADNVLLVMVVTTNQTPATHLSTI